MLYHRPIRRRFADASTVVEHARSFARHSRLGVVELNTHAGFPPALRGVAFDAVVLHYSLFGTHRYHLSDAFRAYVRATDAYTVAFFQDEYINCRRRFDFINAHGVDCIYTCLEPDQFDAVYGRYTSVPTIRHTLTGYVSEDLRQAAARLGKSDAERTIDVGYRGRPLAVYLGRGGQEKELIGRHFAELAAGSGLRLDIEGAEADRLYGDAWHRFVAECRCMLGVESGASAFDLEGEIQAEYRQFAARGVRPSLEQLESLRRWDGAISLRTISPRHFEAAAFRVCQVLFEGRYSDVMEPMRHYIPLRKDFSNFADVLRLLRDPEVRRELTENAHRDLIASRRYDYAAFVAEMDETLAAAGVEPLHDRQAALAAVMHGQRLRHLRSHVRDSAREVLQASMRAIEPGTRRIRKLIGRPRRPTVLPD